LPETGNGRFDWLTEECQAADSEFLLYIADSRFFIFLPVIAENIPGLSRLKGSQTNSGDAEPGE
jgi:hypothetical protein